MFRLSSCEDNAIVSPNSLSKGKVPLAPRSGPAMSGSSSPNLPCTSGALEVSEHSSSINKFHSTSGSNNRKRPLPTGSPSMAQWVGQRPQKISRTRRANLVSPVSTHDEVKMSSEGCSPSDLGARETSIGTNGSLLARNDKHFRVKHEHVSSPARLSESEESGAGENLESRLKGKGSGSFVADERGVNSVHNAVPSVLFTKKNKVINKEKIGDGVHRQGRSGRGSLVSRASISPMGEKLDTPAKPPRSTRLASEKNGRYKINFCAVGMEVSLSFSLSLWKKKSLLLYIQFVYIHFSVSQGVLKRNCQIARPSIVLGIRQLAVPWIWLVSSRSNPF